MWKKTIVPRIFLQGPRKTTENINRNFGVSNRTPPKYSNQFVRSSDNDYDKFRGY